VVKSFRVFEKNHEFCINLNFFYIFRNIGWIISFRSFKSFGPNFFGHFSSAIWTLALSIFTNSYTLLSLNFRSIMFKIWQ
jgi:hypothetical protein